MANREKKRRLVLVIPQQHCDPVWRKPKGQYAEWRDTFISKFIRIARKYPEFTFVLDQAHVIRTYLADHPEELTYLRERIAKGKLEIVCGMEVIPDTNIPCGESTARQALVGQRYTRETFGVTARVAWDYDTFGLSAQTPQLRAKSGFRWIHAIRFGRTDIQLPCYWEGLDGTRILLNSKDYAHNSWEWFAIENALRVFQNLRNRQKFVLQGETAGWNLPKPAYFDEPNKSDLLWYEPVSEEEIPSWRICQVVPEFNACQDEFEFRFALPKDYFTALEAKGEKLPVYTGEMNPEFTGVYTTRIWLKLANRAAEASLLGAEKVAVMARDMGCEYPMEDFRDMWRELVFSHHHDAICGCHIDETDEQLTHAYADITSRSRAIINRSLAAIGRELPTDGGGRGSQPVVLFNTLSWERDDVASVELSGQAKSLSGELVATGPDGEKSPALVETDAEGKNRVSFVARRLPSVGYALYTLQAGRAQGSDLRVLPEGIENQHYRIRVSHKGLVSILDKDEDRELLDASAGVGNELLCEQDTGDLYVGNFSSGLYVPGYYARSTVKDISSNALYARVLIAGSFPALPWLEESKLDFETEVRLYSAFKRVDFVTSYDWSGQQARISVRFPTTIRTSTAHYEIPFGTLRRHPYPPAPLARDGDWPAQTYVSVDDGKFGITLINTGTGGVRVRDGYVVMSLMRSLLKGGYIDSPYGCDKARAIGRHVFRYSLVSHRGNWQKALAFRRGWEVNHPVLGLLLTRHAGKLPASRSFVSVSEPSVIMTALKASEDKPAASVVRFLQATGEKVKAEIGLPASYRAIREVNLIEDPLPGAANRKGKKLEATFGKFEVKSFLLS